MFIELFNLKRPTNKFQTQDFLMVPVHIFIAIFIITICKIVYWPLPYFWSYIISPFLSFILLLGIYVFRPIRFFLFPLLLLRSSFRLPLKSALKSPERFLVKEYIEHAFDTTIVSPPLPSSSPKSLSEFMEKKDSAFMEVDLISKIPQSEEAIRTYGFANDFQHTCIDVPYFSPSCIENYSKHHIHLVLCFSSPDLLTYGIINHLKHKTFASDAYYIIGDNASENDRSAVGCSVYHVQGKEENKDYIAHIYPRSYAGFITCWEFDKKFEKEKALRTKNVICTNNFLIQITDAYNFNYRTVAESLKNPYAVRSDWNRYKNESFYWGFLYYILPGLESALLQNCTKGHLEIVYSNDLSFRIRCIRRKNESDEEDIELLQSYNKLLLGFLGGIQNLKSENYSNLFISAVHYLKDYTDQYAAIITVWHIANIIQDKVMEAIANKNDAGFNFDDIAVSSFEEVHNYLWETYLRDRNELDFLDDLPDRTDQDAEILEHEPKGLICRRKLL
ncbi:hypothetical protein HMI54_002401 [Coelomomyces lativittatus]|nr:hypothetical protein HMI56_002589 [Coelomomyces lativittatus]KAJ1518135.1 hypothetical protein HMI54_002401 [Coelomomyces lativittatus]